MIKKRVIIVEDHPLARVELKYLLKDHPDMDVVGEFETPDAAWEAIASSPIDGVFLDIGFDLLDDTGGLKLARRIRLLNPEPWIIFVTGNPQYALEAHDFRPFGYFIKAVDDDRKLAAILDEVRKTPPQKPLPVRIEVKHKVIRKTADNQIERVYMYKYLLPEEILYIRTIDGTNAVKVFLQTGEVLDDVNITLNNWLSEYDLPDFLQVRRNTIVNLKHVSGHQLDPERIERHLLLFKGNPTELQIGKTFFAAFKVALRQCI